MSIYRGTDVLFTHIVMAQKQQQWWRGHLCVRARLCMSVRVISVCVHVSVCMCVPVCTRVYVHVCVHVYACVHTHGSWAQGGCGLLTDVLSLTLTPAQTHATVTSVMGPEWGTGDTPEPALQHGCSSSCWVGGKERE